MIIVLSLIVTMFLIKLVISTLNYKHSINGVPENVSHIYDQEKYQKWLSYYRDQMKFGLISNSFSTVLMLFLLIFKVFGSLEILIANITTNAFFETLIFLGIYLLFTSIVSIPFDYYQTFVIEEKYGFNKTTKKTFVTDIFKNIILSVILIGGIVSGIQALYIQFSNDIWIFILLTWVGVSIFMIGMFMLNVTIFVKLFNKLTPLEEGSLKTKIDALAVELGFEVDKISIMDASKRSTKLNAFFSGLGKKRDVVLYDTLVDKMSEDQIVAVLGHELSHALNKDTTMMLIEQVLLFGVFASFIGLILNWTSLYTDFGFSGIYFGFTVILFILMVEPIQMLLGIPMNYFSRVAEYKADRFGAKHVSKEAMIGALELLSRENFANLNPHPLYVKLYYNHPTTSERIKSILAYEPK